jgi:transposase
VKAQEERMASVLITREMNVRELRGLARKEKSGRVAARMLAIANVLSGMSRELSARLAGMDRQTLRDWVHRFNAEGVEGLRDRVRAGRRRELDEAGRQALCARVERGPDPETDGLARWRCVDLKAWLEAEHGVRYHENSVSRILREMGFSHISVRPAHPQGDQAAREEFKKTSRQSSPRSSPNAPKARRSNSGSKMKQESVRKAR